MTEFLDGVRDGVKGEVCDLTTVNFDTMELRKLLAERSAWAGRIKKLEENKQGVTAEIWKKLRTEYDQKLKARENELLSVRDRMRKKLEEMVKLKDSVEKECPSLYKRREELTLRFQLGDFNQEFYDYVNAELTFQIDVRQKKVEVLGRNVNYYREHLALEEAPAGGDRVADKEAAEGEGLGKGGGGSGVPVTGPPTHAFPASVFASQPSRIESAVLPPTVATGPLLAGESASAGAPEPSEPEEDEEPNPYLADEFGYTPEAEEAEEAEGMDEPAPAPPDLRVPEPYGAVGADVTEVGPDEEVEEPSGPITFVDVPPEEADAFEDEEEEAPAPGGGAVAEEVEEPDAAAYTDEVSALGDDVEELEEEIEEDLAVEGDMAPTQVEDLDGMGLDASSMDTEEQLNALTIDEDLDLSAEPAASPRGRGRRVQTGLSPGQEIDLEAPAHAGATPALVSRSAQASQLEAGIAAMSEISNVFSRGAQTDPEREEAKKILEEVNLEELERAVEGIEGEGDDEELRGFARDVSGRRGEGSAPPPAVMEVVEGVNMGKVFPLSRTSNVTSIGKAPDNTIALPEDKALSRYHAKVIFRNGKFVIMDLDSTNGTGVNGEAITEADLQDEDEIIMGGARYIFRITARS